jgi:hypothetical protein
MRAERGCRCAFCTPANARPAARCFPLRAHPTACHARGASSNTSEYASAVLPTAAEHDQSASIQIKQPEGYTCLSTWLRAVRGK